ncbi:MAG: macro domain-containing protein [Gammaproteobacteria bacterium]|nr:macro domain-containing protein [Gammaproteobacteria bacterium]
MPVEIVTGNIFTSRSQTLVNTVNCVGVMGAGIALECRLRYPGMYEKYLELCQKKQLDVGLLWLYKTEQRWVLNFPTKKHWKHPSREEYLRSGLEKFIESYVSRGITSIAFPLLGADKGGIAKSVSQAIMLEYLGDLDIPVEIYRYDPSAEDEVFNRFKARLRSLGSDQACKFTGIKRPQMQALIEGLNNEKICQVNQLLGIEGVGLATVEKVFRIAMDTQQIESGADSMRLFD